MKKPILSIVIPTRNRSFYCVQSVRAVLRTINDEGLEIVIHDNSDNEQLSGDIALLKDSRIKFSHVNHPLSFAENFNRAIEMASGEYLCIIGDDDGVLPKIMDIVKWAKVNDYDSIVPDRCAYYIWPGASMDYQEGLLSIPRRGTDRIKRINTKKKITKLLQNGGQKYQYFYIPKIYHGIIKRKCIDSYRKITGHYFSGTSPDLYSAAALCFTVETCIKIKDIITIAGACKGSGSMDSDSGKHCGKLKDSPHLVNMKNYEWPSVIPKYYSVETIWGEVLFRSMSDMGKEFQFNKHFNLESLTAQALINNKSISKLIIVETYKNISKRSKIRRLIFLLKVMYFGLIHLKNRILQKIKARLYYKYIIVEGVSNMDEVISKILITNT